MNRDQESSTISDDIAIGLHDKVLGQHAGELLLDLHSLYADKEDYLDKEKLNMVGLIIKGTRVSVHQSLLELMFINIKDFTVHKTGDVYPS